MIFPEYGIKASLMFNKVALTMPLAISSGCVNGTRHSNLKIFVNQI